MAGITEEIETKYDEEIDIYNDKKIYQLHQDIIEKDIKIIIIMVNIVYFVEKIYNIKNQIFEINNIKLNYMILNNRN